MKKINFNNLIQECINEVHDEDVKRSFLKNEIKKIMSEIGPEMGAKASKNNWHHDDPREKEIQQSVINESYNTNYTHFAICKKSGKIMNGWDYRDIDGDELKQFSKDYFALDLKDMFPDRKPNEFRILGKNYLLRNNVNPDDMDNWYKFGDNDSINE